MLHHRINDSKTVGDGGWQFVESEKEGVGVQQDNVQEAWGVWRDEKGRLLPGSRVRGSGRKSRQYEKDMIAAIREALPSDEIKRWINRALELAEQQNSARGIINVLDFATSYAAGKPVQQVSVDAGRTELLEQLLSGDNGEPLLPEPSAAISTDVL